MSVPAGGEGGAAESDGSTDSVGWAEAVGAGSGALVVPVGSGGRVVVLVDGPLTALEVVVDVSGGASTVDSLELLLTITNASTRPAPRSTAAAAAIHNQRGDFGGSGGGGGGGGYPGPAYHTGGTCSAG